MKLSSPKTVQADLKLWCERCCIRIAPNQDRIEWKGKSYHPRCAPSVAGPSHKKVANA